MRVNCEILNTLIKAAIAHEVDLPTKIAAAVVKRGKIVSMGFNYKKSDPLQKRFGRNEDAIYLHAEIHAIKMALKTISVDELAGCDLYVCRVKRPRPRSSEWVWGLAKPCKGCSRAIAEFDIRSVVYTTDEGTYEVI